MFYSHEVLTSRKYGVATVWLVATLGSKSTLKKVSRKAILDVDVTKACETIVTPEAPMALRLQSNLLYGVTRVYAQQCGYMLNDAETASNNMRQMFKVMRTAALDADGAHRGRADQLILQDDPSFLPDLNLMPIDLDRLDFDMTNTEDSQRSALSPHSSERTMGSQHTIGGLIIPQSASSFVGGAVGGFGGLDVRGDSGAGTRLGSEVFQQRQAEGLLDDDLMVVDDDGNIVMDDAPVRQPRVPSERGERGGNNAPSARARHEHGRLVSEIFDRPDDDGFMPMMDDYNVGLADERLPPAAVQQKQTTSETADAPLRRRARQAPKIIPLDTTVELRNGDLARWNTEYIANMNDALGHKQAAKMAALAKKNAEYWVLGAGLGPLGQADRGPLDMFQGARLLEALTGFKLTADGSKRAREESEDTDTDRHVRPRGQPPSDELGRGMLYDDGDMPIMADDTIEQGRNAPTPLDDRQTSAMPWNQSTGSRRPTGQYSVGGFPTSASLGGAGMQLGALSRRGSRLISASPLMGRGREAAAMADLQLPGTAADLGLTGEDEFELFGPAAQIDTQTAGQSQWQRAALDGESVNFLAFVRAGIEEDEMVTGTVDFETLLPPESNSRVVAAQALLHVLTLGTKNLLQVDQVEAFAPITMRAIAA